MVEQDRPQMTVRCMRIAWWITKATDTDSEYGIPIAFPLQEWVQECASMSRYVYAYAVSLVDNDRSKSTEHNNQEHKKSHTKTVLKPTSEYFMGRVAQSV
jgi:hypothetical protein